MRFLRAGQPEDWIVFTLSLFAVLGTVSPLKCYQCLSASLEPCPEEDYKACPASQAFDRCSINIKKTASSFVVKRDCTLGPCQLRDSVIGQVIKFENECDLGKRELDCLACCRGDGCNKDGASTSQPNKFLTTIVIGLCIASLLGGVSHSLLLIRNNLAF